MIKIINGEKYDTTAAIKVAEWKYDRVGVYKNQDKYSIEEFLKKRLELYDEWLKMHDNINLATGKEYTESEYKSSVVAMMLIEYIYRKEELYRSKTGKYFLLSYTKLDEKRNLYIEPLTKAELMRWESKRRANIIYYDKDEISNNVIGKEV